MIRRRIEREIEQVAERYRTLWLRTALTFLLRTLASTAAVLCLALSTRWTDLLASLGSLRIPAVFLQTIGMTVRYLHLLLRQAEEAHLGKKCRSICRRPLASEQMWVGSRIAATWEKSLSRSITRAVFTLPRV